MGSTAPSLADSGTDYAILSPEGKLLLRLEVKARRKADPPWAVAWRRNHHVEAVPTLLVTPERIYGWRAGASPEQTPDLVVDSIPLLSPYLTAIATGGRLDPQVFEWVVGSWLQDVLAGASADSDIGVLGSLFQDLPRGSKLVDQT